MYLAWSLANIPHTSLLNVKLCWRFSYRLSSRALVFWRKKLYQINFQCVISWSLPHLPKTALITLAMQWWQSQPVNENIFPSSLWFILILILSQLNQNNLAACNPDLFLPVSLLFFTGSRVINHAVSMETKSNSDGEAFGRLLILLSR